MLAFVYRSLKPRRSFSSIPRVYLVARYFHRSSDSAARLQTLDVTSPGFDPDATRPGDFPFFFFTSCKCRDLSHDSKRQNLPPKKTSKDTDSQRGGRQRCFQLVEALILLRGWVENERVRETPNFNLTSEVHHGRRR